MKPSFHFSILTILLAFCISTTHARTRRITTKASKGKTTTTTAPYIFTTANPFKTPLQPGDVYGEKKLEDENCVSQCYGAYTNCVGSVTVAPVSASTKEKRRTSPAQNDWQCAEVENCFCGLVPSGSTSHTKRSTVGKSEFMKRCVAVRSKALLMLDRFFSNRPGIIALSKYKRW